MYTYKNAIKLPDGSYIESVRVDEGRLEFSIIKPGGTYQKARWAPEIEVEAKFVRAAFAQLVRERGLEQPGLAIMDAFKSFF